MDKPHSTMTTSILLQAPAKINVTLEVVEKLPNGYHAIRSVFVRLDRLVDAIDLRITAGKRGITISSTSRDVPADESNTCHRAAAVYLAAIKEDAAVHVHIGKNIPIAAGLGGGSSDAAAVLVALNRCFKNRLPDKRLEALGADIGKDVPFFVRGEKVCHVSGMGEKIRPIPASARLHFLIVNPGVAVSTAEAYKAIDRDLWFMANRDRTDHSAAMVRAMSAKDFAGVAATLFNDFEACAERAHPMLKEIKQALRAFGAGGALMSGSGSTVFGLFRSKDALLNAEKNLRAHYPGFFIAAA